MSRHRIRSILWSVLDVALYPVIYTLAIPVFMNNMGEEVFGIWMLINAILVTFQLFSFGLGTATFRNVSKFLENKNGKEISKTLNTNLTITLMIGVVCMAIALILVFGIRNFHWFNVEAGHISIVSNCILLAMPLLVLKFIEQIFQYTVKAYERFSMASMISMGSRFGVLFINLLLIVTYRSDLETLLISNILYLVIVNMVLVILVKQLNHEYTFELRYDKLRIREEINYGWWTWVQSIFVILAYQGDRFLVMNYFGPSKLAYYSIVSTMFNHIHMCFFALAPWVFPKVAKMVERGEETPGEYFKIRGYIIIFALLSLMLFYSVNDYVLSLWLGAERYYHIRDFVKLFTVFELFFVFTIVPYIYCNSAGHEKLYTKVTFLYTSLSLVGMFIGCKVADTISGMLWGLIVATVIGMMLQNFILNRKIFHQPPITETFFVFVPSMLMVISMLYPYILYQIIALSASIILLYRFYYTRMFNERSLIG